MPTPTTDATLAGALLRLAITPRSTPTTDATYREGIEAYLSLPTFRAAVDGLAEGLGLRIVEAGERGLVVAPTVDSLFAFSPRDFRPGSAATAEARVLDGLFMLAIVAACYPRAADLADDPRIVRPPITVDHVERLLRDAAAELTAQADVGDATPEEQATGLEPAWRALARTPDIASTADGRAAPRTSRQRIKRLLERLTELGAFTLTAAQGQEAWQPTYRWQVQIQEFGATAIWEDAERVLRPTLASQESA
jgi:hypothetical protein